MKQKNISILRATIAFLYVLALMVVGALVFSSQTEPVRWAFFASGVVAICVLPLLLGLGVLMSRRFKAKRQQNAAQIEAFMMGERARVQSGFMQAKRKLRRLRYLTMGYVVILVLLVSYASFTFASFAQSRVVSLLGMYFIYGLLCHIHPIAHRPDFSEYATETDYPVLYALAHKAAAAIGTDGDIRICLMSGNQAASAKLGKVYSIQLGVVLLAYVREEELYQILLHEFAHIKNTKTHIYPERRWMDFLADVKEGKVGSKFFDAFLLWPGVVYAFNFAVFDVYSSLAIEVSADQAMREHGTPQVAANALAKVHQYQFFEHNIGNYVGEVMFESETFAEDYCERIAKCYIATMQKEADLWQHLLAVEIQPRNATHPIFRDRMKALGVTSFALTLPETDGAFREECVKGMHEVDKKLYDLNEDEYRERRRQNYLMPKKRLADWEDQGRPYEAERVRQVISDLFDLRRMDEIAAICEEMIATQSGGALAYAKYIRGNMRVHQFDVRGIEDLYHAIELNPNYTEESMEIIGAFCCMMGLEAELEEYRKKVVLYHQKEIDESSHTGSLEKSDNLTEEHLPPENLERILAYIQEAGRGWIEEVYLVRKVITDTFFSSCFVIKFFAQTSGETVGESMDLIFEHLDTAPEDWQYSLFLYTPETKAAVRKVEGSCIYRNPNPAPAEDDRLAEKMPQDDAFLDAFKDAFEADRPEDTPDDIKKEAKQDQE